MAVRIDGTYWSLHRERTMGLANSQEAYGGLTKWFHWIIVILFALQYTGANIMMRIEWEETFAGLSQADYYNWHKSLGLVALAIAIGRIINRQMGRLPDWAPSLTQREKGFIHRNEQILYLAMFIMPISGYFYVMAGGFGVMLFGVWKLPDPIGKIEWLAFVAKWVHKISAWVLLASIVGHLFVVLRHHLFLKDGLLRRMLPGGQSPKGQANPVDNPGE